MAFDPKVAAGGVAVVAIGGGAGVAIHKGTQTSSETKENPIQLAIEVAGFTLKTIDQKCTEALEKEFNDINYKAAVVACAAKDTFKKRAEELKLEVLNEDKITDSSSEEKTKWDNKWSKNETIIKTLKESGESGELSDLSKAAPKIKAFCEKENKITTNTKTSEWYKYLKICVKEDEEAEGKSKPLADALTKDFWHNKVTMGAKMKFAKFTDKTPKGTKCTDENLNKPYESKEYKTLVMDCSELSDFRARATVLELTAYPSTSGETFWTTGWDEVKDRVSSTISLEESKKNTWDAAKEEVKKYCDGSASQNKTIDANTTDEEWKKYLNACTKEATDKTGKFDLAIKKDFWTGEIRTNN